MGKSTIVALLLLLLSGHPVSAGQLPVDLELVLADDTSLSMDANERNRQLEGYAEAFRDPEVVSAILGGPLGRVAVSYVEWSSNPRVAVPWTLLQSRADVARFAAAIAAASTKRGSGATNITAALELCTLMIIGNQFAGSHLIIDISGDGQNNSPMPPDSIRDEAVEQGITINGLPLNEVGEASGPHGGQATDAYYRDHVIGGPGAFLVVVNDSQDFGRAIRQKVLREITAR